MTNHLLDRLDDLRRKHGFTKAKESPMPDNLAKIAEDIGIVRVAKAIVDGQRNYGISESEFVSLVTSHAKAAHPNLTEAAAFSKVFEGEEIVRRACAVLKSMPFVATDLPSQAGGAAAQALDDPSAAIAQLREIGRNRWPSASEAAQFANAMTDPANAVLASKAHVRPRPTTSYEFPR
jgi:hypothetical protein